MSKSLNARFQYDTPFTRANVEAALRALSSAVDENWRDPSLRDEWSTREPIVKVDVGAWLAMCDTERMSRFEGEDGRPYYATSFLDAEFSPLSTFACSYIVGRDKDENLSLALFVWRGTLYETAGAREQRRMEAPWDEVRRQRPVRSASNLGPDEDDPTFDAWWEKWNQLEETPPVWMENKRAIQNIVRRLRTVLPVRSERIDDQLCA